MKSSVLVQYQVARCPHDGEWHLNNHIAIDFHISVEGRTIVAAVKIPLRISNPSILENRLKRKTGWIVVNAQWEL